MASPDVGQRQVNSLWNLLLINIAKWGTNVTDHDKRMVAGTVFMVVRATLTQYYDSRFSERVSEMLNHTLQHESGRGDDRESEDFLGRLAEETPCLCEWINSYDEQEAWLSDQIAETISQKGREADQDDFIPSGETFSKTALLTDRLIDIMGQRLSQANKLDASPNDFRKLFSGIEQQFTITWKGKEGELRDLFKMLTDGGYVNPKRNYQNILQSHFLNARGGRFRNLHGAKSIKRFQPVIDDCEFLLQHLTDNMTAIMKRLVEENGAALDDMGYFGQLQAAKQSGLSIRKKRR